jgi:hypothetical protein
MTLPGFIINQPGTPGTPLVIAINDPGYCGTKLTVAITPCAAGQSFGFPNTCQGVPGPPPVTIWKWDGSISFNGLHSFGSGL